MHCIYACSHTEHGSEQRIIFLLRSICLGAFVPTSSVKDNFRLDNWNYQEQKGLPWWPRGKESACNAGNAGNPGSIPAWADPLERKWQPTLLFFQENPKDRAAWWATVPRVAKRWTRLSDNAHRKKWGIKRTSRELKQSNPQALPRI